MGGTTWSTSAWRDSKQPIPSSFKTVWHFDKEKNEMVRDINPNEDYNISDMFPSHPDTLQYTIQWAKQDPDLLSWAVEKQQMQSQIDSLKEQLKESQTKNKETLDMVLGMINGEKK